jgi:hypothetical protein
MGRSQRPLELNRWAIREIEKQALSGRQTRNDDELRRF